MSIKTGSGQSLKTTTASGLRNGVYGGIGVRPLGYEFPIGNRFLFAAGNTALSSASPAVAVIVGTEPTENVVFQFTTSGTYTPNFTGDLEALIVAGGGSGAPGFFGGSGGAGGLIYGNAVPVTNGTPYTITVGAAGNNSSAFGAEAYRGGNGGSGTPEGGPPPGAPGGIGGSGGGGGAGDSGSGGGPARQQTTGFPVASFSGFGNNGGGGGGGGFYCGGGGGGAGGPGNGGNPGPGVGGNGVIYSISGSPVAYAAGGTGGFHPGQPNARPGAPIGGTAYNSSVTANRGSGGPGNAQSGASGIVVIRHLKTLGEDVFDIN